MEYLDLGCAPANEDCAQVGVHVDYPERARRECRALIGQLIRICGEPPPGVRLRVKANEHDFGTYYSVVVEYNGHDETGADYAWRCDENAPGEWDDEARRELESGGAPRPRSPRTPCPTCSGRGRLDNPGDYLGTETCPTCAGTGRSHG
jgi:hypothetical protein